MNSMHVMDPMRRLRVVFHYFLTTIFFASLVSLSRSKSFAHGEETPGPHGGEIRMPGGFHTEVKSEGSSFRIYLLDVMFKNPVTEGSKVQAEILSGNGKKASVVKLSCGATNDPAMPSAPFFRCGPVERRLESFKKGDRLRVLSSRQSMTGKAVVYDLPLTEPAQDTSSPGQSVPSNDHRGH